jgi:hypothetical protein
VRLIAKALMALARLNIQVIVASHSYFLLKEIDILRQIDSETAPVRFFALDRTEDGVSIKASDELEGVQPLVALDEELSQYDRSQALFYKKTNHADVE